MAIRTYDQAFAQAIPVQSISEPFPDFGADFYSDTTAYNGNWHRIQCLTDAVIDLTGANWGGSAKTAVALKAGTSISGRFPYLKLASGTVVAYRTVQSTS